LSSPIPVTILSGFLGAGKTTLLRHLLKAEHGLKIAVIENEFSDAGIDTQLLGDEPVQVMTLSNGCVCCTIHTDLTKALYLLLERLDSGEIAFDRLVIECTGLADPAPVAQTFFIDEELRERYILDGIITLVDAAHADTHLTQTIAQAQIGFADRLLVSKRDLVDEATFTALSERLTRINRRAPIRVVEHGKIDLAELLDVRGFNLNADLGGGVSLRPVSKAPSIDRISSLVLRTETNSTRSGCVPWPDLTMMSRSIACSSSCARYTRSTSLPSRISRSPNMSLRIGSQYWLLAGSGSAFSLAPAGAASTIHSSPDRASRARGSI